MSRMWGSTLDNIVDVEVVLSNGRMVLASDAINAELFWAMRGAGSSFGIATKFTLKTYEEPARVVESTYTLKYKEQSEMAAAYSKWQKLASDPELDRRFWTQFIAEPLRAVITGTFYGTEDEFKQTGISDRMPEMAEVQVSTTDWTGSLAYHAKVAGRWLGAKPVAFDSRSLALTKDNLLSENTAKEFFCLPGQPAGQETRGVVRRLQLGGRRRGGQVGQRDGVPAPRHGHYDAGLHDWSARGQTGDA
jgi:FAD/FMN-containing dehydrogenase